MAKESAKTIIYVTRDLERALGPQTAFPSFFIITNSSAFAKEKARDDERIFLVESTELLDTPELLARIEVQNFINSKVNAQLMVFKNLPIIEKICAEQNWPLLNPSAKLAQTIEEKISQVEWLGELVKFLPEHEIKILKEVEFKGVPFILQFNRAHTGTGTILIDHANQLTELSARFPDRPVRVTKYISGTMLTSNNIVAVDEIIVGNINQQITGLKPFTDNAFATIGNDWALPQTLLNETQRKQYAEIVTAVGKKMQASGWKGLFGTDIMLAETGELYLIEINARQPASTTFESTLQSQVKSGTTTFAAHLLSLNNDPVNDLIPITDGAQIILRNQTTVHYSEANLTVFVSRLKQAGFTTTQYTNTEPGSDLVRIQSPSCLMKSATALNERGEAIVNALNCSI